MRNTAVPVCIILAFLLMIPASVSAEKGLKSGQKTSKDVKKTDVDQYLSKSLDTGTQSTNETEEQLQGSVEMQSTESGLLWFFVKIGLALGVVIAGIWVVSKVLEKSGMTGSNSDVMGVRSTLPLGKNQYLQIVQVGKQYFMLGVTDNEVSMLDELTDSDTIKAIRNDNGNQEQSGSQGFSDVVSNVIGVDDHEFNQKDTENYLEELQQKVNKIGEEEPKHS